MLAFTVRTMPDFQINWHHRVLCHYLDLFAEKKIKRLIVSMPPRHGKSELVSRRFPAYIFGKKPNTSIISCSYGADLASRMNRDVQRIIETSEYNEIFPATSLNGSNVRSVAQGSYLRNSDIFEIVGHKGVYRSAGVGGGITGMGGEYIIIDDPIKNQEEADSEVYRQKVWDWYTSTLYTRLEKEGCILITMTRWHEDDLVGRLLDRKKSGDEFADEWTVVDFPAIKDTDENPLDPREMNEALWEWKYPIYTLKGIRASVGGKVWNALYQQRPSPPDGNIVKRSWWQYYETLPEMDQIYLSADLTYKEGKTNDFAVFQIWGKLGARRYLIDQVRERMGFTEQLRVMQNLCAAYPKLTSKWIEDAANGAALIDFLRDKIPGIIAVKPRGSKLARAESCAPMIEAQNVYLPSPNICSWIHDYVEEWASFPAGKHDDQVDSTTQALNHITNALDSDWMPISLTGESKWLGR